MLLLLVWSHIITHQPTILKFTPGKGAELVEKVVQSAAANAENNFDMNPDELYVAEVYANQGPTMKRFRAGAQGRASMILKRTSHIGVTLKEKAAKTVETVEGGQPDGSEG